MRAFISRRSVIWSIAPFSSRNSARWKPSGRVSRTVCSMTRGPAKPIRALGSARTMSPRKAKLADTPPMVGSVSTEMKGSPFSLKRCSDALVLVICISELSPSCILAPPEAATQTKELPSAAARRTPCTKRSPTTEPIEPPMKRNSKAATTTGWPFRRPFMTTKASSSPVAFFAAVRRSGYFLLSLNLRMSVGFTAAPISSRPSSSSSRLMRSRAPSGLW